MRDQYDVYDLFDAASWCIGVLLLPLALLWRCLKLAHQLACDE